MGVLKTVWCPLLEGGGAGCEALLVGDFFGAD